jgi:AcrR family transcriptional regulator
MQRPNETKRRKITDTAARLFATRPFHKVRLDDVAAGAQVGKGTLYVYFKGKDDLYRSLVYDGLSRLVDQLNAETATDIPPDSALEAIVRGLVRFAFDHPNLYELGRLLGPLKGTNKLAMKREELVALVERTLRRGIRDGIWTDPRPELTAVFIPGFVRSAMLYGPAGFDEAALAKHILRVVRHGLVGARGVA